MSWTKGPRRGWELFPLLTVLLLLSACGSDLPEERLSSEHFTVYYRSKTEPCAGLLEELEAHRLALVDWLGVPEPARIHYYIYEDRGDLRENSPCGGRPCAGERDGRLEVHTDRHLWLDDHELVHVYLRRVSDPPLVLTEGLAVALECHLGPIYPPDISLEDLLSQSAPYPGTPYYDGAGYLVRFLLDEYGKDRFLEFYRAAHGLDLARFRDAFEDFFGRDIEEAWELAARVEPYRVAACPCALGGARAGEDVSHDGASRCQLLSRLVFEVGDEPVRVEVDSRRRASFRLASCFGDTWAPTTGGVLFEASRYTRRDDPGAESLTRLLYASLAPGRYFLAPGHWDEAFALRVTETKAMGTTCAALEPDPLAPRLDLAFVWDKRDEPYVGIDLAEPSLRLLGGYPGGGTSSVPFCSSCGALEEECTTSVAAELSGETWLGPLTRLAQTLVSNPFSLELAAARDFVEDDE